MVELVEIVVIIVMEIAVVMMLGGINMKLAVMGVLMVEVVVVMTVEVGW